MKVSAVAALKAMYPLHLLLMVAGLARSTYFYHQRKRQIPDPHTDLKTAMQTIFTSVHGRYGYRRMHIRLVADGWCVGKKLVRKLMRELGLVCKVRRRKPYISYRGEIGTIAPNLLNREFTATAPNQKWVTDITQFRIGAHNVYCSPIMDLFDRQIIAWSVGISARADLTLMALQDALRSLPADATPIVHSDQGAQYHHASWQHMLTAANAQPSMSRRGNCLDNAVIENFFGHLKEEMYHHTQYATVDAFMHALHDYIHWYNTERISTRLMGLSPVQYRKQALASQIML